MKIKFNENNNRVNITRPAWPTSEFAQDLKAMYGEFLEPGEEDKQAYEDASQYLLESNKKYEAEQVVKAYASGGWRKALSVIADLGIAGTAGLFGVAMFGLYTWGGPITAAAIGFGLLHALLVGTYGEVIKALLLGADNLFRRNPKMEKLLSLAKKDAQATEIVESIKKEMDKEKPVKDTLKVLKKDLEKRLKELEKEQVSFKEDADMKYVLEGNLFDNIRAKRERIAKGSGEKVAKPGDEDYPENLKKIAKEAALNEALATPKKGESKDDFISRFMGSELAMKEFPDHKQRIAVAFSQLKKTKNLNEELFKADFAIEIDGQKTGVIDAENEDDAISKIIEKFNIDVENIEDLKKVEPELNEGWKTKLGLAALGAAAMTGGFKNTPNIEPIQGYASKIVDKADDVGKTFVKSANIIGNKAKDVVRGGLDYAENIGSKFTQKVDDMMNQVDNADNERIAKEAINESYTDEDLLELFEALELDTYKYNFEYLAEQLGFEILDEGFVKDFGTNIKGITKDALDTSRQWGQKGGDIGSAAGAIIGTGAGALGGGAAASGIIPGLQGLQIPNPEIGAVIGGLAGATAGRTAGWGIGTGIGALTGIPVGVIQGLKKANKGEYINPPTKISTDEKIDNLTNAFNDYIAKQNNINNKPVTNEPNNTDEIPVENKDLISEASRNAPHVIKGKYIRLDNGQVIEPEPDYWDDYVPPKIEKFVKPEVVKDPSDNPDLYEEDPNGQLRFKLKESSSLLTKYGVEGYNKPKRTPSHKTKSHLVVAKKGDKIKVVRFGAQGVSGSPKKDGESEAYRKRRQGFVARHKAQNPGGMKDKFSALYWANKVKW